MKLIALALVGALGAPWLISSTAPTAPVATSTPSSQATKYDIDGVHSSVVFRIQHLGVSYAYGRFNQISGSFHHDPKNPSASSVEVTVKTDSVDTADGKRDAHLKSPDFFNAAEFPTITFKSTEVKKGEGNKLVVVGDLSLHGVTKSVTADVEHVGAADTPMGSKAGFEAVLTLKREDFGMGNMVGPIGNDVRVIVSLEGDKAK